jgi:hypothetical protein
MSEELKKICEEVENDLTEWFQVALTLESIITLGHNLIIKDMTDDIDTSITCFKYSLKTTTGQYIDNQLSFKQVIEGYSNYNSIIVELVFLRIVQHWYDFLNKIIELVVKEHISGVKIYKDIPITNVAFDLNNFCSTEDLPELIKDSFDKNIKNIDKTKKITKCLGVTLDNDSQQCIKKAIIVRNLLEHNKGIVRQKDLNDLGGQLFLIYNGELKQYGVNARVVLTTSDLYDLVVVFKKLIRIISNI